MQVRVARRSDLPAIVEIYNQAVASHATADLDPVTVCDREPWFGRHDPERYPILVATSGDTILGWLSLSEYRSGRRAVRQTAEVSYYVHEDHRRSGVATRLVREAMQRGADLGFRTLFAILLDDNVASVALLERLGFEEWGRLPRVADFDGREVGHLYYGLDIRALRSQL